MQNVKSQTSSSSIVMKPVLSLILCSRNDQYMGNSCWRLQTTINYVSQNVSEMGKENDVEIIVADWGSEIPLRDVLELSPAASKITSFLLIPPQIARVEQNDSPFPEVLALNAAARLANGQFIGRIDADTLVGKRFLQVFFDLVDGSKRLDTPVESTLIWAGHRGIPYRFAARSPSLWQVQQFLRLLGHLLPIDFPGPVNCFFDAPVGIWLLPRACWEDCGGYDESFIYWGHMEIEMIFRLTQRYSLVHLEDYMDCNFFHLEHYHPRKSRATSRRINPKEFDSIYHPNNENWGLIKYHLEAIACYPKKFLSDTTKREQSIFGWPLFIFLLLSVGIQMMWDGLILLLEPAYNLLSSPFRAWKHRVKVAWKATRGHPVTKWPGVLMSLWAERQSRLGREK
jgi:hypothetical protein